MLLEEVEKEHMVRLMRRLERFTGVKVLTFCIMTNHMHLLLDEGTRKELSEEELLHRMRAIYDDFQMLEFTTQWERWRKLKLPHLVEQEQARIQARMHDISEFMKQLKQRFTCWYNRENDRCGTLWEARFKSVVVEGGEALLTMAAYIDLNPVRAMICDDPKDYRFCGMGEACAGRRKASAGITEILRRHRERTITAADAMAAYRHFALDCEGKTNIEAQSRPVSGRCRLSRGELLRCRVRHFTEGLVIGRKGFTAEIYRLHRARFGPRRKREAWPLRGGEWGGLCSLRELRDAPGGAR